MEKGRFLIETHLRTGQPIAKLAADHGGEPGLALQALGPLQARRALSARAAFKAPHVIAHPLHHIGVGNAFCGWRVVLLVAGREVRILGLDGSPVWHLILDPTRDYRRIP